VMGRVCPAPCESGCNRNQVEDYVGINSVEHFLGEYAIRNNLKQGRIYYSQEFARNEEAASVQNGKTRSFWQTGFEIFGSPWLESSLEAILLTLGMHVTPCCSTCDCPVTR